MSQLTATLTLPSGTPTYAAGDLMANSATAGSVTPIVFGQISGVLEGLRLRKSSSGLTNANFRLWLFELRADSQGVQWTAPTVVNGDDGAFQFSSWRGFVGRMTCASMEANAGAANQAWGRMEPADATRYAFLGFPVVGFLEARAAYQRAASEVFTFEGVIL